MNKLSLSPSSERDLEEIFNHTFFNWGIDKAERYHDDIFHGMRMLLDQKNIGKKYSHSNIEYRRLHVNKHLIFYRYENTNCIIMRILHERMDLKE